MNQNLPDNHSDAPVASVNPAPRRTRQFQSQSPEQLKSNRFVAFVFFFVCLTPLMIALYISPTNGLTQTFGVPECGFKKTTGLPCISCGMTTSFTYAVRGDFYHAFMAQPGGLLLATLAAVFLLVSAWSMFTGMSMAPLARILFTGRSLIALIVFIALSWGFNVLMTLHTFG